MQKKYDFSFSSFKVAPINKAPTRFATCCRFYRTRSSPCISKPAPALTHSCRRICVVLFPPRCFFSHNYTAVFLMLFFTSLPPTESGNSATARWSLLVFVSIGVRWLLLYLTNIFGNFNGMMRLKNKNEAIMPSKKRKMIFGV